MVIMNKLIIAEKPSVALRIALAFSERPNRKVENGVSYFEISSGGDTIYIVAAAGHLFSLAQKQGTNSFPVFEMEWVPAYKSNKFAYFTKKYLDVAKRIGSNCQMFINACDYDLEGTVIGTNIIKYILEKPAESFIGNENIKRMVFSTTTTADLLNAYENIKGFDSAYFEAGETRHIIDWMWGINMSRALMGSLRSNGINKTVSIGRVQGPTLAIAIEREKEIETFKPMPFWKLFLKFKGAVFENTRGEIFEKRIAEEALDASRSGDARVIEIAVKEEKARPLPPFDLTSLQIEASRTLGLDPSRTLQIAQALYERSYISYPRTSSQKLPPTLNLPRIISDISKNPQYAELANRLIAASRFRPAEGLKQDEAHPAIFPTGVRPAKLTQEEEKLYDLIAKRFLACFAEWASLEKTKATIEAGSELYSANGTSIKERGWIDFYAPYSRIAEETLPQLSRNEKVEPEGIYIKDGKTQPPKRYSKASLILTLEKKNLGTKATRSEIISTLFKRGYIKGTLLEATDFGKSVYNALHTYCSEILDENMTRKLENDMEEITKGKMKEEEVIREGKEMLTEILADFRKKEKEIGKALSEGLKKSELAASLGTCSKDGGMLLVRRSRLGKQFVSCSNWPNCDVSYPLPSFALVLPTGKVCEICHTPIVKVIRKGKKFFQMDLDPNCPTKAEWKTASQLVKETEEGRKKAETGQEIAVQEQKKQLQDKIAKSKAPKAPKAKPRQRQKITKRQHPKKSKKVK
jgi:DNA topoisomerase-1